MKTWLEMRKEYGEKLYKAIRVLRKKKAWHQLPDREKKKLVLSYIKNYTTKVVKAQ